MLIVCLSSTKIVFSKIHILCLWLNIMLFTVYLIQSCKYDLYFLSSEAIPYTQYIVPVLLLIGWIVGCVLMVYFVFS